MRPNDVYIGVVPEDAAARLRHLSNVFGRVFLNHARGAARERARSLPEALRSEIQAAVDASLYAVIQVLDGVTRPIGNDDLDLQFVLSARLRAKASGEIVDEVELGPSGEGLCLGFHGWVQGDFGSVPS